MNWSIITDSWLNPAKSQQTLYLENPDLCASVTHWPLQSPAEHRVRSFLTAAFDQQKHVCSTVSGSWASVDGSNVTFRVYGIIGASWSFYWLERHFKPTALQCVTHVQLWWMKNLEAIYFLPLKISSMINIWICTEYQKGKKKLLLKMTLSWLFPPNKNKAVCLNKNKNISLNGAKLLFVAL